MISAVMPIAGKSTTYTSGWPKNQNKCCHKIGSPPRDGSKNAVLKFWSKNNITAPAINGPTLHMNKMEAMTIIHTTYGMSKSFMPGAREFIAVVMKLMPPMRNATNSSATATIHIEEPNVVIE